jgi:hypothetical protein
MSAHQSSGESAGNENSGSGWQDLNLQQPARSLVLFWGPGPKTILA